MFEIIFTDPAQEKLDRLQTDAGKAGLVKQIKKILGYLQTNPRHPSLRTHEYHSVPHPFSKTEKVFEAYAQNRTPAAYRIFWCYGPKKKQITILAITPHP